MFNEDIIQERKKYLIASKEILEKIISSINTKHGFEAGKNTTTYGEVIKHPTQNKWMLVVDSEFYSDFTQKDLMDYGVVELSKDWN